MLDVSLENLGSEYVLVADNEISNVHLMTRLLQDDVPCKVLSAMNVDSAVRLAVEQRPAVVLLDLGFPEPKDAVEVCRQIRQHFSRTEMPIILITAQDFRPMENDAIAACFAAGADDFIERAANSLEKVLRVRGKLVAAVLYRTVVQLRAASEAQAAALRSISGKVAHDLRTPLTYLLLSIEAGDFSVPPRAHTALKKMKAVAGALARHTSVSDPGRPQTVQIRRILDDVHELTVYDGLPAERLLTDATRCTRSALAVRDVLLITLLEIVGNAISVNEGRDDLEVKVTAYDDDGGQVCVSVRDNGAGVPQGDDETIFQERYTTRSRGTGLGLAFARADIMRMNGTLQLVRDGEPGAHFRICLPSADVTEQA